VVSRHRSDLPGTRGPTCPITAFCIAYASAAEVGVPIAGSLVTSFPDIPRFYKQPRCLSYKRERMLMSLSWSTSIRNRADRTCLGRPPDLFHCTKTYKLILFVSIPIYLVDHISLLHHLFARLARTFHEKLAMVTGLFFADVPSLALARQ